ncbi:hypothetical protein [Acetivibrio clariflavus]|uniref:hypothetical protein n=1 Tax=Acetivibrio clariflavus TaxID=288965 RepID=UPI0002E33882|nr:hypothetical protein [Acetivibrio clariflavus]
MHDKNKKAKKKINNNSSSENAKRDIKNNVQYKDMPVEIACSPEFPQGCITVDDEIDL